MTWGTPTHLRARLPYENRGIKIKVLILKVETLSTFSPLGARILTTRLTYVPIKSVKSFSKEKAQEKDLKKLHWELLNTIAQSDFPTVKTRVSKSQSGLTLPLRYERTTKDPHTSDEVL